MPQYTIVVVKLTDERVVVSYITHFNMLSAVAVKANFSRWCVTKRKARATRPLYMKEISQ